MTDEPITHITDRQQELFKALTSGEYNNFALFSCFVNGEPTVAIVTVDQSGDMFKVIPHLIFPTPSMVLTNRDGVDARGVMQ